MSDEEIDFIDIPEINKDFLKNSKKIEHPQNLKTDTIKIKPHLLNKYLKLSSCISTLILNS